ncbi:hypothetical protein BDV95DRAFT_626136 [Massariosphaeria phaeospora]|uniref:Uncharacterized protein n=1 Tax=Massariosphaeria phaeospora TaxID=100035 RepID=A0A7C8MDA1_9PLEO|nr:hypothetical protein BDV95DRAFT_626136 [Massariosphaeria phaeospora]
MGKAHRMFHRRAAPDAPKILTVPVEVVATIDGNGNVIAQETHTPALPSVPAVPVVPVVPAVPAVPAVPTVPMPSVPPVPPFPSDLTVPAYPFPSGVPTVAAVPPSTQTEQVLSSSVATTAAPSPSSVDPTAFLSSLTPNSTTITSTSNSLTISSSIFTSDNTTSSSSTSSSSQSSSSSSQSSSSSTSVSSVSSSTSVTSILSSSSYGGGGGGDGPASTAPPPAETTAASTTTSGGSGNSTPLNTPQVVGTVFGSLAGLALLLVLVLFFLKRHKQKQNGGPMQLRDDGTERPPMTASTNRHSLLPAAFLNRFSGASRSTAETSTTTAERGFQRVSGRKLPSAFSEGMTSEQFARGEGALSGSSFYKDDSGFYGGPGAAAAAKEFGKETGEPSPSGAMGRVERVMPSPARTPIITHPDDAPPFGTSRNGGSTLSPPLSPNPDYPRGGTLGRSHPSHDGSRSSRFTENV